MRVVLSRSFVVLLSRSLSAQAPRAVRITAPRAGWPARTRCAGRDAMRGT